MADQSGTIPTTHEFTIPEAEEAQIQELHDLLLLGDATLTSPDGRHTLHLSKELYGLLVDIIKNLADGNRVSLLPETQDMTTQQAANYLGMSRQFLVSLIERGAIPFHKVGTHRRLKYKNVKTYRDRRDEERHSAINDLAKQSVAASVYDEF